METKVQVQHIMTSLGLSEADVDRYSLTRAIQYHLTNGIKRADFEMECSREIEKRIHKGTSGFYVPYEIQNRALDITTLSTGGYLIGTSLQATSFVDLLRAKVLPVRLGMQLLPLQRATVSISRKIGGASGYWLGPGDEITVTDPEFDLLLSAPRTVGCLVKYSRDLLIQSTPSIDSIIMGDIASEFGVMISTAAFHGGGGDVNEPIGLDKITGVGSLNGEDLGWETITDFEGDISNANADFERAAFVMSPTLRALLRKRLKNRSGSDYVIGDDGRMCGSPTIASNCITDGYLFYGDWTQGLLIEYGILEILVNPYTEDREGMIRLRGLQTVDTMWGHPDAFAMSDNVS